MVVQDQVDIELVRDFLAVDGHDDVAAYINAANAGLNNAISATNAGGGRRPTLRNDLDKQAFPHRQIQRFGKPARQDHRFYTEECTVDAAGGDQVVGYSFCHVDGNGEADTGGRTPGRGNWGGFVDDFRPRVDGRAPRIFALNCRLRLDGFLPEGGFA